MTTAGIQLADDVTSLLSARFAAITDLDGPPRVSVDAHIEVARMLRDELGYRLFGFVIASHHPSSGDDGKNTQTIRLVYSLRKPGPMTKLAAWQLEVEVGQSVPSLVRLFAGADWQEREQFDLIGIRFQDHPDLRRLMLSEDWNGHPLRKDYAIDTEVAPWR